MLTLDTINFSVVRQQTESIEKLLQQPAATSAFGCVTNTPGSPISGCTSVPQNETPVRANCHPMGWQLASANVM